LLADTGAGATLTVAADDRRSQSRAASRDLNRLAGTATPRAGGTSAPGMASSATVRPSTAPSPSASPSATPVAPAAATKKATAAVPAGCSGYGGNQLIACTLLPTFGFALSQMSPLVNLWNGESGWRTTAQNPSSGAYGIPQSLPAGKMASAGADWRTNPATQIRWGLGYIKATYGSPAQAWAMWQSRSPHWY
jgi:hypothetical protein